MVFRRRMSSIRPVNRVKHILDSEGVLTGGANSTNVLAVTVPVASSPFKPGDIPLGSTINGMFLSVFVIGATGAPINGSINWYIAKTRAGQSTSADFPGAGNTGVSEVRNQIFHEEKGLAGSGDGTAMAFKGVVAIPRGMRRFREGDSIFIKLQSQDATSDAQFCIKAIFNVYS